MSLMNVVFDTAKVRLYSDTMKYRDGRPSGFVARKTFVGARLAVGTRGNAFLCDQIGGLVLSSGVDLDGAEAALESVTSLCLELGGVELTFAGWSARRGDLAVLRVKINEAGVSAVADLGRGVHLMPAVRGVVLPPTLTRAQAIRVCQAQERSSREFACPICIGGVLHETVVTAEGITQQEVVSFSNEMAHG